ncbi:MAG: matrixin family metalloprotease [Waterburya sp.]
MNKWRSKWQKVVVIAISTFLSVFVFSDIADPQINPQISSASDFPSLQAHALPEFLAKWQDKSISSDYFDQIESTPLGYLVWSEFPLKIYVEKSENTEISAANQRFQQWTAAVKKAIAEWNVYFPLEETTKRETADIVVLRSQTEREAKLNPDTGLYDIPRAIAAQTNYEFYLTEDPAVIALRMTVRVSPNFAGVSLLATIRHELGHALGIWGHSPAASDALYFSQVSDPASISPRDINTLKKIYQQPTRLGWKI